MESAKQAASETFSFVSVEAGKNRPYYLKSKGKDNGAYIRVAGRSRQAFLEKIKELEMEGARIHRRNIGGRVENRPQRYTAKCGNQ